MDLTTAGITNLSTATWSIFGANFDDFLVSMSRPETTTGVQSTPWTNGASVGTADNDILTMVFSQGTASASSTAPNSFTQSSTDNNSYGSYVFGSLSPTKAWESFGQTEGGLSKTLDLYRVTGTGSADGTFLGAFTYDTTTGLIKFTAAIPEPATAGLLSIGLPLIASLRFRRRTPATC